MNSSNLVVLLVVAVLFFLIGGAVGMFFQAQKDGPQLTKAGAFDVLSSKVVASVVAYGKVTAISGRSLTLSFNGSEMVVPVAENAPIYAFPQGSTTQQKAAFADIKAGNNVNVNLRVSPNGAIEGQTVIVLPQ